MQFSDENLRFYVFVEAKRGVPAKEVFQHLRESLGKESPSQSFVYKWYKDFSTGERESIQTLPRSGRPISLCTSENISRVFDFVEAQPKSTLTCIAGSLELSKPTVYRILSDELLFSKVCSVWVPHKLTEDNKIKRVTCCQSFLELFNDYSEYELLRIWATQDESWIPFEMTAPKENNKVWIAPQTPRPRVIRPQLTFRKTMLSIVFTGNGKVSAVVTEAGETVDSDHYIQFVHRTGELWRKLRSDSTCLKELLWQHDNARPHTAASTKAFFKERKVILVEQAPYSPDLNQCDRWLFKYIKDKLRERDMSSPQDVLQETLEVFRQIPLERFKNELQSLREHCHKVITCGGDYITKSR
jgi:histone-lysine N-methyltransferase SETMAR